MTARINLQAAPGAYRAMLGLEAYLSECGLEVRLMNLIKLRVSQINACGYCIDMHWKDLRVLGESEQRMYSLDAWSECSYYTARERAALAWAEAVTAIRDGHVSDAIYEEARVHFPDKQLADLTLVVATINAWNRIVVALRVEPGTYRVHADAIFGAWPERDDASA